MYLCTYDETPIVLKVFKSASGAALERELSAVSYSLSFSVMKQFGSLK